MTAPEWHRPCGTEELFGAGPAAGPATGAGAAGDVTDSPCLNRDSAGGEPVNPAGRSPRNQGVPGAPGLTRSSDNHRASLTRRLTERDREILRAVERHRVLTTDHIAAAFFPSPKRAWSRLAELHRWEVLARFQPFREGWGAAPLHYVVGRTGAAVLAAEAGEDAVRAARQWRLDRAVAIAHRRNLQHIVGLAGIWASLAAEARREPTRLQLVRWLTERELALWVTPSIRPDALLEWREDDQSVEAFLEYDRGTEAGRVLLDKLRAYEALEVERGRSTWVLFAFISSGRELAVRAALAASTVPVATAVLADPHPASAQVWLPLTRSSERIRLSQLGAEPKPFQALQRAASGSPRAWRFETPPTEGAPIGI